MVLFKGAKGALFPFLNLKDQQTSEQKQKMDNLLLLVTPESKP